MADLFLPDEDDAVTKADKPKSREAISLGMRFHIMRRDNFTCQYCGAQAPDAALHVDHIVPVVRGGGNDPENLIVACVRCNIGKGARDAKSDDARPETERERKLRYEIGHRDRIISWFEWASHIRMRDPTVKAVLYAICSEADPAAEFTMAIESIAHYAEVDVKTAWQIIIGLEAVGVLMPQAGEMRREGVVWMDGETPIAQGCLHVDWGMFGGLEFKPPYKLLDYVQPLHFSDVSRVY